METSAVTEAQLLRAEANRLAALAKRKALADPAARPKECWGGLSKCRKLEVGGGSVSVPVVQKVPEDPSSGDQLAEKFRVRLEICSPDSFSATPLPVKGFAYPGEDESLRRLTEYLVNAIPTHYTQSLVGGKACVYKLNNYDAVFRCLKSGSGIEYEEIPWGTFNVIEKLSRSVAMGRWMPCRPEHLPDEKVNELIAMLPTKILDALLPFQLDGIKFGLQRGGRCLIADEMGLGKTLQAIAIACSFMSEGPILVVCPAVLRFSWAEELERWFPCLPSDIHLVFGHQNNPSHLKVWPKIVVISFKMLHHLRKTMLDHDWAVLIVDESHHLRCSKKPEEPEEIRVVLDVAMKINRIVLLSGTPSLSRPGLLGKNKFDFAKTYCGVKFGEKQKGKFFKDFSRGTRLEELNILLKQTVMIRRLKEHVMAYLPPKRRQIIRLLLKKTDIASAKDVVRASKGEALTCNASDELALENADQSAGNEVHEKLGDLSYQELGIAKLSGFLEWLSLHPVLAASDGELESDISLNSHKMIIFAHHHKVLNRLQEYICEKGVTFVRIDGNTLPRDRQSAVISFQTSSEVKIAIIGITAGGVGLNLSAAKSVVFLELPPSSSWMLQAEDRAHRQGQTNAVNIYYFCAKDTLDDLHWQHLNRSLYRVSSTTNGKNGAIREIAVEDISYLGASDKSSGSYIEMLETISCTAVPPSEPIKCSDAGIDDREYSETLLNGNLENEDEACSWLQEKENDQVEESIPSTSKMVDESGEAAGAIKSRDNFSSIVDSLLSEGTKAMTQKDRCDETNNPVISDEQGLYLEDSLRFEVSKYTGRIHLYSCILGADTRPRPLFQSFRPEELVHSQNSPVMNSDDHNDQTDTSHGATCKEVLQSFLKQWSGLRPIQRKKLLGRPLRLPLAVELCCMDGGLNHNAEGVLKGKSKRRTTPLLEISHPLPENAVWKNVCLFGSNDKKKAREYTQGWSLFDDEPLCKLCQQPCRGKSCKEPEFFEDLFCNLDCYEEYRLRTSRSFLRQELFHIEHGVCTNCQLDCHKLVKCLKPLSLERRREYILTKAPQLAKRKKALEKLVNEPNEGHAWHADHIVPVFRGGGECLLENMRTLCVACHSEVTAAQNAQRRGERAETRKRLKLILKNLEKGKNAADQVVSEAAKPKDAVDDDLLVEVPGSAYSAEI